MEDLISSIREGNTQRFHDTLEKWDGDINDSEEHGFTPLHWAAQDGRQTAVDLLIARGANVHATNMGEDTPLHLAASYGHSIIIQKLIRNRASVNAANEHGNTPLHYAAFWAYNDVARELLQHGALVTQANKYGKTPVDLARGELKEEMQSKAKTSKQPSSAKPYAGSSGSTLTKTSTTPRMPSSTLTMKLQRPWIAGSEIVLKAILHDSPLGELWKGNWSNIDVIARRHIVGEITNKMIREIPEDVAKLKSSSHPNILPVLGICQQTPSIFILSEYMPSGSLYAILHQPTEIVVDQTQVIKFTTDIARGMAYVHSIRPNMPRLNLTSRHVLISPDLTAKISLSDCNFSFLRNDKLYYPHWMSPEVLQKQLDDDSYKAADMWSFAVILWELVTREMPFSGLSPMEIGMKIALEQIQPEIPPGTSPRIAKLIRICWNLDPVKRPKFDMIIPILEKM